jgi:hypothetical protein
LFTIKGNLVFMKNLYHKIAVASVYTALGFALGADKEVKAATFNLAPTIRFEVIDISERRYNYATETFFDELDEVGDFVNIYEFSSYFGKERIGQEGIAESRLFMEFNIDTFSFLPNEDINRVLLQSYFSFVGLGLSNGGYYNPGTISIFGYVGNGTADISDFGAGELLSSVDVSSASLRDIFSLDVTPFVKQRVSNGDPFAGFGFRVLNSGSFGIGGRIYPGDPLPDSPLRMVVETTDVAEPVPEPTTIFGSAIGLYLGGWLKRKKSTLQNKTTS